MKDVNKKK